MKQIFIILLSLAATANLAPQAARAATNQPTYTWHGPGCKYDNSNWAVCSIDPPPSNLNDDGPCYVDDYSDYMPNAFDRAAVALCQAAEAMLDAPASDSNEEAHLVSALAGKFFTAEKENHFAAFVDLMASALPKDFANFNADLMIYNASPSAQAWQSVVSDLQNIASDTQIQGYP